MTVLTGLFVAPSLASAQTHLAGDACSCYCTSKSTGAMNVSASSDYGGCQTLCVQKNMGFLGCYEDKSQGPESDDKCWTKDECDHYATDTTGNPIQGTWGGQHESCAKTKSGQETGYCYAPPHSVALNVAILGRTEVFGFNEYLSLAYRFLLPAMSLLAVVMIMVGGLEYLTAGGNSKQVDKAKHRISNAIVGLVILMSAYTIAYLLDPSLVDLSGLRTPLLKRAVFLDPSTSCETLIDKGFVISPDAGVCGQQGIVQNVDNVEPEAQNSNFDVGDTCDFFSCATSGTSCVVGSSGVKSCLSCGQIAAQGQVSGGNVGGGVVANAYICGQAAERADAQDDNEDHKYQCFFDASTITLNQCVQIASAGSNYVNCSVVKSTASGLADPCKAYEDLRVTPAGLLGITTTLRGSDMYGQIEQACASDPCGVGQTKGFRGCAFTAGSNLSIVGSESGLFNACNGKK